MKTTIIIQGMHCNSCKLLIEDACSEIPGVKTCHVDFKTGKVNIEHEGKFDLPKLKKEIEGLGKYKVVI